MRSFIQKTALIVLLPLLFVQCDSLLETEPIGSLTEDTFYQTPQDFAAATLGAYSTLTNIWSAARGGPHYMQMILWPTDDMTNREGSNDFEEFVWTPTNGGESGIVWANLYKGVLRSNTILERLPEATGFQNEADKEPFAGQAKFLRAWFYFRLAVLWGNPPLVTEPITSLEETRVGNADQNPEDIWDLMEQDLAEAAQTLPESWPEEVGRATSGAARALLGKVQLFRAQWFDQPNKYMEAEQNLQQVVNSGTYQLVMDFSENFREDTENNAESLFEIQMSRGDFNPWLFADWAYEVGGNVGSATGARQRDFYPGTFQGESPPGSGSGAYPVTQCLVDEFEANDPRRLRTVYMQDDPIADTTWQSVWSPTGYNPSKYVFPLDPNANGLRLTATSNNERDLRYGDVLLMLAEAEIQIGQLSEAAMHINEVRARARNNYTLVFGDAPPPDLLPDVTPSDASTMMEQLMHERRVELFGEAHRWDDLVRWHHAGFLNITEIDFCNTIANQNIQDKHLLRPIPQSEIDLIGADLLIQNTGY